MTVPYATPGGRPLRVSGLAIASLVCSLVICLPVIHALLGLGLGIGALAAMRSGTVRGRGMAIAGITISIIVLIGWAVAGYAMVNAGRSALKANTFAQSFVQTVATGNFTIAQPMTGPPMTAADLATMKAALDQHGTLQSLSLQNFKFRNSLGSIQYQATFNQGSATVTLQIQRVNGGGYCITGYSITP